MTHFTLLHRFILGKMFKKNDHELSDHRLCGRQLLWTYDVPPTDNSLATLETGRLNIIIIIATLEMGRLNIIIIIATLEMGRLNIIIIMATLEMGRLNLSLIHI